MNTRKIKKISLMALIGLLLVASSPADCFTFCMLCYMMELINKPRPKISIKNRIKCEIDSKLCNIKTISALPTENIIIAVGYKIFVYNKNIEQLYSITITEPTHVIPTQDGNLFILNRDYGHHTTFFNTNTKQYKRLQKNILSKYTWLLGNKKLLSINLNDITIWNIDNPTQPIELKKIRLNPRYHIIHESDLPLLVYNKSQDIMYDHSKFFLLSKNHLLIIHSRHDLLTTHIPISIMNLNDESLSRFYLPSEPSLKEPFFYHVTPVNQKQFVFRAGSIILLYQFQPEKNQYNLHKQIILEKNIMVNHFTMLKDEEHFLIVYNTNEREEYQLKIFNLSHGECIKTEVIPGLKSPSSTRLWTLSTGDIVFAHANPVNETFCYFFHFEYQDLRAIEILAHTPLHNDLVKIITGYSYHKSSACFFNSMHKNFSRKYDDNQNIHTNSLSTYFKKSLNSNSWLCK
ncbi:MAG: hypothetical protein JO131_02730 [Gammaproteobacteria bacterium]|nr:hypothetical protein [Gammaproteobacteria bacterium]